MRVDTALLCEAATVREGLLYVLGGGIQRIALPQYPAVMPLTIALRIMLHRTELDNPHELQIRLLEEDGDEVVRVGMGFGIGDASDLPAGEEAAIAVPWNFPGRPQLPHPGRYSLEILIDDHHQASVSFKAEQGEAPPNAQQQ
jgi:hypothetical protein